MADINSELKDKITSAIRLAVEHIAKEHGGAKLFAFALCTDDDVMTLFSSACTRDWVAEHENEYGEIGYIYTEWNQESGDSHFEKVSRDIASLYDVEGGGKARDNRFEAIVLALKDCREAGIFDQDTLLCCGSTDPSDHLEMLAMDAVDRLNIPEVADRFAHHLGYEHYRKKR